MFWKANRHGASAPKHLDSTFSAFAGLALFTTQPPSAFDLLNSINRYANVAEVYWCGGVLVIDSTD